MEIWEMDLERLEALDQQSSPGFDNGGIGKRQRDVKTVFAQAKAVELQRSEAALRKWLANEQRSDQSAIEHRAP